MSPGLELEALREALDALQMPKDRVEEWLLHLRRFCEDHGGAPRYAELLSLIESSLSQLPRAAGVASVREAERPAREER